MGNTDTKLNFRKAFVELTTKTRPIDPHDEDYWNQFWSDTAASALDVFTLIPANEIRTLRDQSPNNLATLTYKSVEKLVKAVDTSCRTQQDQMTALNCVRLLTRIIPYMFEDADWRTFFWSSLPSSHTATEEDDTLPLAKALVSALCDLLFCPDFTVSANRKSGPDRAEDLQSVDSCEYIWEAGVGAANSPNHVPQHDCNRTEILKLLLACFSETIYIQPSGDTLIPNKWIEYFSSGENRHALPLFTSLLNVVCSYDPVGIGLPYNHLIFADSREPLVEAALQVLVVVLDHDTNNSCEEDTTPNMDNLFINYISRIHREEDFYFILKGFTRLLNNPLTQTYLPNSTKKIQFHQELLVFFWKMCDYNKKFLYYVLKSSDVLDILVPILYHLNDSRADQSRVGLMHIGVFILLLLSGERNFGVRLNKPYTATMPMDIPVFTGTHADLLIIVFHKIITTGHQRLQPLFDCLLTILVNVSPYLKTLSMVSSTKLLHFLEAFSTPWFLFSSPNNHHLIFFLLEIFNNIIQYQFDGNSNLVYTIIRKRQVFHALANLATDSSSINRSLMKKAPLMKKPSKGKLDLLRDNPIKERKTSTDSAVSNSAETPSMEGSHPALPAEPGTLKVSLASIPGIEKMTERESAHPSTQQLNQLTRGNGNGILHPVSNVLSDATNKGEVEPIMVQVDGENNLAFEADSDIGSLDISGIAGAILTGNETPAQIPRSSSMPLSHSSPAASKARNLPTGTSGHGVHMQRSFSVLSTVSESKWSPSPDWVQGWKSKLPLQTVMRLLQVLVPQVEKICIDKGLTDESEILKFLQHGTLVGLLPVPHPILIRKYQANSGTTMWFRTYMWGVIYLRNTDPPVWYDTDVRLFEIQRV
ncbi:unnamed protein product [Allacma fusca]|uniref:Protein HID1 n=1 Tax=Allacma fusca TaxID=39272 RepID=A0A8J2NUQ9_9HEXA|nr:unnamed protein product [Allacma fusca]